VSGEQEIRGSSNGRFAADQLEAVAHALARCDLEDGGWQVRTASLGSSPRPDG
jgi:hypothetical protein